MGSLFKKAEDFPSRKYGNWIILIMCQYFSILLLTGTGNNYIHILFQVLCSQRIKLVIIKMRIQTSSSLNPVLHPVIKLLSTLGKYQKNNPKIFTEFRWKVLVCVLFPFLYARGWKWFNNIGMCDTLWKVCIYWNLTL